MFANVLVGVDGRTTGRDAIALARDLVATDGKLTLAHVHDGGLAIVRMSQSMYDAEVERSRVLLRDERRRAGVTAELAAVAADTPGHGLHQLAEDERADLLVVGSCSRGRLGRAMLGDDARAALNGAPCAIAIAPVGYDRSGRGPISKVGVAFDGSSESESALTAARTIAAEHHASIHALEVVSLPSIAYAGLGGVRVGGATIQTMLEEARARLAELADVDGRAVNGLPGEELARFGDEVDLLVVGSRGYGPVRRVILGSTSNYLERHARCALLVLPRSVVTSNVGGDRHTDAVVIPA